MTTIILDINQLPNEYKASDRTLKESINLYEKDFNIKVIPIDLSRSNIQNSIEFLPQVFTNS